MVRTIRHRKDEAIHYRRVPIHAPPRVHEEAFDILQRYTVPGQEVIELGAGSGAFAARMLDSGLNVTAVDIDALGWALPNVPLIVQDLNAERWEIQLSHFDCAVAIEVIEHIENPCNFLRNAARILKPGGILFFTTPNVLSVQSRRRFITRGELAFFRAGGVFDAGHLSILPYWLLDDILEKEDFVILDRSFIGQQPVIFRPGRPWWKCGLVPLVDLLLLVLGYRISLSVGFASNVAYTVRPRRG